MNFAARELETIRFWKENDIVKKSFHARDNAKDTFTFFDGPPTANGKPHIGHVETRAIKDLIPRYYTMKGKNVLRKAGWDTHGLPVELEVEKKLGLDGKPQIEQYGIEPFIQQCKESVWKYLHEWEEMSDRVGYWVDMEHPYVTYHDDYIESEWWSLKTIAEKGLIYKGHKIVPYCPRCGTALSSHEVAQGYKNVKEKSAFVRFPVKGEEGVYLLAWTTTPWTLPSNLALCVNAHETYCRVKTNENVTYIMAKALVEKVLEGKEPKIVAEMPGSDLVGTEYVPLYRFVEPDKKAWFVVSDDYVTMEDGTGIVHIAPAYGEDDNRVCRENGLPFVNLVDTQGKFIAETAWAGTFIKDADPMILHCRNRLGGHLHQGRRPHDPEGSEGTGPAVRRRALRPRLSLLLALRHAPHVLRPPHLVHQNDRPAGRAGGQQPQHQLVSGQHQGRPHGQFPGKRGGLGPVPRALLGHAAAHLAVRRGPHARDRQQAGIAGYGHR